MGGVDPFETMQIYTPLRKVKRNLLCSYDHHLPHNHAELCAADINVWEEVFVCMGFGVLWLMIAHQKV